MSLRNLLNFIYLAVFLGVSSAQAQCILNRYGHELCVGDSTLYHPSEGEPKLAQIKAINYNIFTIKLKGEKLDVEGADLIGKRSCNYYKSPFCKTIKVKIKSECEQDDHSFKTIDLFYNDFVHIKQRGLFSNKDVIIKSDCLDLVE